MIEWFGLTHQHRIEHPMEIPVMKTHVSKTILSCDRLQVGYRNKTVLTDVNLSFDKGQFISLLGPNGAGKTTLLRTLSRHLPPLGGRISLKGNPLETFKAMDLAKIMAVVLTDRVTPPLFTVFEFAAIGRYPHTDFLGRLSASDITAVHSSLQAVHADHLADRPFSDLSDGERQKVLMARSLAQQPEILLLDEPTVHLDLKHRVEVMSILRNLCRSKGITVVASLHDVDVAAKVSDRVALVKDGGIRDFGPPETVLTGSAVAGLYDFSDAGFDRRLGSIELKGTGKKGRAFVLAGMGSGSLVYRLLAKQGYAIATGVVPTNDLDYFVARSLGADIASRPPMEPDLDTHLAEAESLMERCDFVIDSGFPEGFVSRSNTALLGSAIRNGQTVFALRQPDSGGLCTDSLGQKYDRLIRCRDEGHLAEALGHFNTSNPDMEQMKGWNLQ